MLKRVQAGIQRIRSLAGPSTRSRLPITATLLRRIGQHLTSSGSPHKELLWAVACTAFFGFFRLGELLPESASGVSSTAIVRWGDIAVDRRDTPTLVKIHLRCSKCDQFGKGVDIIIGRTGCSICPVTAIVNYLAIRGTRAGPLFQRPQAQSVTKAWFVEQLRDILSALGLPPHVYAGHSFRIGAATTAALAGVEDSTIQTLGRWQSGAFLQYIRMPRGQLAQLSGVLARDTGRQ